MAEDPNSRKDHGSLIIQTLPGFLTVKLKKDQLVCILRVGRRVRGGKVTYTTHQATFQQAASLCFSIHS